MKHLFKITILLFCLNSLNAQYIVNDAFKKITLYLPNITSSGAIGDAFETVDHYSSFAINQTSTSKVFTLPTPSDTTWGDDVTIRNIGSASFTMYNVEIFPDSFELHLTWKRGSWKPVGNYFQEGASSCPCCEEYNYFDSDTAAYYQGRHVKGEYYLSAASHKGGYGRGVVLEVPENYGWELLQDNTGAGFNGLMVMSRNTTRVGFDGAYLPACRIDPPAVDLQYYDSISSAIAAGLSPGDFFLLTKGNKKGLPEHTLQQVY